MTLALRALPEPQIGIEENRALGEIVRRHEALRTTFPSSGGFPAQVIAAAGAKIAVAAGVEKSMIT